MAGSVASADIGMWQVPQDMLTLVHHNELVMPAAEAGAFRSLLGDGGPSGGANGAAVHIHPTTNVHVSALDAGSVSQWMQANTSQMLKAIDEAVRHGAALGLKRLQDEPVSSLGAITMCIFKLGRRRPSLAARRLQLADYLSPDLPVPPAVSIGRSDRPGFPRLRTFMATTRSAIASRLPPAT